MSSTDPQRKVYAVAELTRLVKSTLEESIGEVWVEGELSNVRRPSSGHYYFTLKDESSQLSAVLFRGDQRRVRFSLKDGMLVRVFGAISVYERSGNYQIIVRLVEEGGQGALQARFEALKEKLRAEGLFDESRKRPIPMLPQHVGVVTSSTGAAIRDILNVISRRFPNLHLVLFPVKVQGAGAAEEIADAVDRLNARGGLDVLIVGRGGGSLEDLWCFNEEIVARAIARSLIPVVSAVGHEIDFTIADFVADLRAPTPSAAAELVVDRKDAFEEKLQGLSRSLVRSLRESLLYARHRLLAAERSYVFREPGNLVGRYRERLNGFSLSLRHGIQGRLREAQQRVDDSSLRVLHAMEMRRQARLQDVRRLTTQIGALNPLAVLRRGYTVTTDVQGRIVRSVRGVRVGQKISTRVIDGSLQSEVRQKERARAPAGMSAPGQGDSRDDG